MIGVIIFSLLSGIGFTLTLVGRVMLMQVHETSAGMERERWAEYAGMNIETGVMQLVRAVALP